MDIQITIFHNKQEFKPISTIIKADNLDNKRELVKRGMTKIATKKGLTPQEIYSRGYTIAKVREYDKEKIQKQYEWDKALKMHQRRKEI